LLNKIKNVLFEEEEIEIPVEEPVKEIKKEEKVKVEKKKNVYEEIIKPEENYSDRELFKAEKTFDFPIFDDKEFDELKESNSESFYEEEPKKNMSINLFDYENPREKKESKIPKTEEIKGRAYDNKKSDFDTRKFKPSPVISPVYGVLDKNYKKEDIVVIKQEEKKSIDVEAVRKKAFGTLEDGIEKLKPYPINKKEDQVEKNSPEEEKTIDELLEEAAFDSIQVSDRKEEIELEDIYNDEEEAVINLENLSEKKEKSEKESIEEEDDTLESDLFDLIDSMYENKEEE